MTDPMNPNDELPMADEHVNELQRLQQQVADHLDGWKRAKADYLNLKKQSEKEKQELAQFAQAAAVLSFLPVYDNLKRAWDHVPQDQRDQDWVKGFQLIAKQFEDILKQAGLSAIDPQPGDPFDPAQHHAVSNVKADGTTSGAVVATVKMGWRAADKVLEPAQVTVAE